MFIFIPRFHIQIAAVLHVGLKRSFHHDATQFPFVATLLPPQTFTCQTYGHSRHFPLCQLNSLDGNLDFIAEN